MFVQFKNFFPELFFFFVAIFAKSDADSKKQSLKEKKINLSFSAVNQIPCEATAQAAQKSPA